MNLTILPTIKPPPYAECIEAVIAGGVRILETAGHSPRDFVGRLKAAGVTIVHKCTSVRHAVSAQRIGVDVISIDGFECAGHPGEDDVPGLVLIPAAVKALRVPVVASGGIATGAGMAAALALGAEGVNMGTRFCATAEAPIHEDIKRALVEALETDTQLILRTLKNSGRVMKNQVSNEVIAIERRPGGCEFSDVQSLVSGQRGRAALQSGDFHAGLVWAGHAVGLIDDIPTCEQLLQQMVAECRERLARAAAMVAA